MRTLLLLALGAPALVSCNETPITPRREVETISSRIEVDKTELHFGAPIAEEAVTREFTISSVGNGPAMVDVSIVDETGFLVDGSVRLMEPGDTWTVPVTYESSGLARDTTAVVHSNATIDPDHTVALTVNEALPVLLIEPDPVDFGKSGYRIPVYRRAVLTNDGVAPLVIDSVEAVGDPFDIVDIAELPITLAPGESTPVDMVFEPLYDVGTEQGHLRVTGNAHRGGEPVPLLGESILGGLHGRICDPAGTGWVANARVVAEIDVDGDRTPDLFEETTTDADGYYIFDQLPRSEVRVIATKGRLETSFRTEVSGGGIKELPEPSCLDQGDLRIAVLPATYDDVASILDGLGLKYTVESPDVLHSLGRMRDYDLIFGGCASVSSVDDDDVEDFIREGGSLYVSDLSVGGVSTVFDENWDEVAGGLYGTTSIYPMEPAMITRVGTRATLYYESVIGLSATSGSGVTAVPLIEVDEGGSRKLATVRLDVGDGSLVLSTFHASAASSPTLLALFEEVIWGM